MQTLIKAPCNCPKVTILFSQREIDDLLTALRKLSWSKADSEILSEFYVTLRDLASNP